MYHCMPFTVLQCVNKDIIYKPQSINHSFEMLVRFIGVTIIMNAFFIN